ncbi:AtpZ/AtpI family protein [Hoeflea sp. CAU 1731]
MNTSSQDSGSNDPGAGSEERKLPTNDLEGRRERLEAELASRRVAEKKEAEKNGASPYARAFQLSTEFVAAIFVGAFLGYWLDRFAGTTPWGMIILLLLGFVAGVLNVMRSAGVIEENRVLRSNDGDKHDAGANSGD